jgi:hypothetical protein
MLTQLDLATQRSADPPDAPPVVTARLVHTGKRGRPRKELDLDILATGLSLRHGPTLLAPIFGCDPRTIRRRALEHGLVQPGNPVYVDREEGGQTFRVYTSSTGAVSPLSDAELDVLVGEILTAFPNFGRRMIQGRLEHLGHHVPRERVRASYNRVHGPPPTFFGSRRIKRRVYSVPGPNSLCHHDGQHGKSFRVEIEILILIII